jgi:hypothetical protein
MAQGGCVYVYDDEAGGGWGACVAMAMLIELRDLSVMQALIYTKERLPVVVLGSHCQELLAAYR